MVFRTVCFLALPVHSSSEAGDAHCWSGEYTEERCCDLAFGAGNPECWDGVYTYERCCHAKFAPSVAVASGAGCWSGGFTQEQCCDPAYETGNPSCWDGVYTYQRCCPKDPADLARSPGSRLGAQTGSSVFRESCWGGNLNAEMWCCSQVRDPACWQGGDDYQKCCKRDASVIASLFRLQNSSVLPVVKKPNLEYPFPSASQCGAGGQLDQTMCDLLQAAENVLRRPRFEQCWFDGLTREHCCNTVLEGRPDPRCFDDSHTYGRCCVGVSPPAQLLQKFYGCDHCVSFLKQSTFSCHEYRSCLKHGGTIIEMAHRAHGSRDVLCLPQVRQTNTDMLSSAAFTLEWVTTHHASATHFDAQNNLKQHVLEIGCLLAPWFLGARFWFRATTSGEDMARKKADHVRNWSLDVARLIGIAAVIAVHLPLIFRERNPQANQHLSVWNYSQRFVDIFGVVSVLVTRHSESMLDSWDALWRKLARQLPLSFILVRHLAWTGGLCRSVNTCDDLEQTLWSSEFVARCLTFSYHWYLIVDIKLWLLLRSMYILNHHGVSLAISAAMTLPVSCACFYTGYLSRVVEPQQYYQLWTYRLPMSLLVLFVSRSKRFQSWGQHTWLWSSIAMVLCGLGWVRCIPKFVEDLWQEPCTHDGLDFILGGVFFHLGVTMLCLQVPFSLPKSLRPAVSRASQLSLGLLTLHCPLLGLVRDCEDNASPWLLVKTRMLHFHIASLDPSPRMAILLWATLLIAVPLLAQLVFWIIQRPWEELLIRFPKPVSRSITVAYLLYFAWCWRG